jgi:hypothetical protein
MYASIVYVAVQFLQKRRMSHANYKYIKKLNSVAFSPQANYTDRATAACRRS